MLINQAHLEPKLISEENTTSVRQDENQQQNFSNDTCERVILQTGRLQNQQPDLANEI